MARTSVVVRVGIPTLVVAVLATAVAIAVNLATTESTTSGWAWMAVGVVTLASAAASLWLYRRTQVATQDRLPAAPAAPSTGPRPDVEISGNTFHGPTGVQGSGVQHNRFGA